MNRRKYLKTTAIIALGCLVTLIAVAPGLAAPDLGVEKKVTLTQPSLWTTSSFNSLQLENDAIGHYFPKAAAKMAAKPYYATYWTYQEFLAFVAKYADEGGYHGHQTQIYEPREGTCIGTISIMFHPTGGEFAVAYTPTAWAMKNQWLRPIYTEWTTDLNTAYALVIALAYPNLEMWESVLNGGDQEAAIVKYQELASRWGRFSDEEMKQFVKNLGG